MLCGCQNEHMKRYLVGAGCQKLHVIGPNYDLLILTAPKALAGLGQCAEGARRAGAVRRRRPPGQCTLRC